MRKTAAKAIGLVEQKQNELALITRDSNDALDMITATIDRIRTNNARIQTGSDELTDLIKNAQELQSKYQAQFDANDRVATNFENLLHGKLVTEE